jgi:hypothetical protein
VLAAALEAAKRDVLIDVSDGGGSFETPSAHRPSSDHNKKGGRSRLFRLFGRPTG